MSDRPKSLKERMASLSAASGGGPINLSMFAGPGSAATSPPKRAPPSEPPPADDDLDLIVGDGPPPAKKDNADSVAAAATGSGLTNDTIMRRPTMRPASRRRPSAKSRPGLSPTVTAGGVPVEDRVKELTKRVKELESTVSFLKQAMIDFGIPLPEKKTVTIEEPASPVVVVGVGEEEEERRRAEDDDDNDAAPEVAHEDAPTAVDATEQAHASDDAPDATSGADGGDEREQPTPESPAIEPSDEPLADDDDNDVALAPEQSQAAEDSHSLDSHPEDTVPGGGGGGAEEGVAQAHSLSHQTSSNPFDDFEVAALEATTSATAVLTATPSEENFVAASTPQGPPIPNESEGYQDEDLSREEGEDDIPDDDML